MALSFDDKVERLLVEWTTALESAESVFKLEGRKINQVAREHSEQLYRYERLLYDIKRYEDLASLEVDKAESIAWRKYTEGYSIRLSATDIRAYVSGEPEVISAKELKIEISTLRHHAETVVEAIKNMGWMISHLTKLFIEQLEESTI